MTSAEEQLRDQLKAAQGEIESLRRRLEKGMKVLEPILAIARACQHLPEHSLILSRAKRLSVNDWKTVILEVRHTNALLAWANEEEDK